MSINSSNCLQHISNKKYFSVVSAHYTIDTMERAEFQIDEIQWCLHNSKRQVRPVHSGKMKNRKYLSLLKNVVTKVLR